MFAYHAGEVGEHVKLEEEHGHNRGNGVELSNHDDTAGDSKGEGDSPVRLSNFFNGLFGLNTTLRNGIVFVHVFSFGF
eukprot:gene9100-biopygen15005